MSTGSAGKGLMPAAFAVASLLVVALVAGCESGSVVETSRSEHGVPESGLSIVVRIDAAFQQEAEALGWTEGVPDAEVRLHRVTTPIDQWITARTDSAGVARFASPLPGDYRIVVTREAEHEGVLRAFAGGRMRYLGPGDSLDLTLRADVAGTLVLSEWCCPSSDNIAFYDFQHYHKIFNNSAETIHLDGMLLGRAFSRLRNYSPPTSQCSHTEPFRLDPEGIWFYHVFRFPGTGNDHAIGPGEEKLIAMDAIDHRPFSEFGMDLRGADFETLGPADVDNPAVPNMPELGPQVHPFNHGLHTHPPELLFLARDTDLAALPRRDHCILTGCDDYTRMPKEHIFDAVGLWDTGFDEEAEPCSPPVEPVWDQMPGGFITCCQLGELGLSAQRRLLRIENGRRILMDTNVSAADFMKAPRTVN